MYLLMKVIVFAFGLILGFYHLITGKLITNKKQEKIFNKLLLVIFLTYLTIQLIGYIIELYKN